MLASGACALALARVQDAQPMEWASVPLAFLLANAVEWALHCQFMHHLRWLGGATYRRHALHHVLFVDAEMAIRCMRELRFVLIHPRDLATLAAIMAAVSGGFGLLATANCGWLALATCAVYLAYYETSHLLCHYPAESRLGRMARVQRLRRFHARHHRPELMGHVNFNVTVPVFDWVFRTLLRRTRGA
jgi:Fatty acid hydroxylase superfamily